MNILKTKKIIIFLILFISLEIIAKNTSTDALVAKLNFKSFLKCAEDKNPFTCSKRFFAKKTTNVRIEGYLRHFNDYKLTSGPKKCPKKIINQTKNFIKNDEFILCSIFEKKGMIKKTGHIYFKKNNKKILIKKIKLFN